MEYNNECSIRTGVIVTYVSNYQLHGIVNCINYGSHQLKQEAQLLLRYSRLHTKHYLDNYSPITESFAAI